MQATVVILTKLPGHMPIKTRLHGLLGKQGAEEFYLDCLARTIRTAQRFCERPILATSPEDVDPETVLRDMPECRMTPIRGEDGAVCLENALALAEGPVIALGGDAPDLPVSRIRTVLGALKFADAVFDAGG